VTKKFHKFSIAIADDFIEAHTMIRHHLSSEWLSTTVRPQRGLGSRHMNNEQWAKKGDAPNKSPINHQMFLFYAKPYCACATR